MTGLLGAGLRPITRLGAVMLVLASSAAVYAWMGSNGASASRAGDGSHTISSYTISSAVYNFNSTSPQNIDSVTVTVSETPTTGSTMKLGLAGSTGSTTWYTCTNSGATLTCPTTSPQATAWGITQGGSASGCPCTTSATGTLSLVIAD